jgi:hypothetical protein
LNQPEFQICFIDITLFLALSFSGRVKIGLLVAPDVSWQAVGFTGCVKIQTFTPWLPARLAWSDG